MNPRIPELSGQLDAIIFDFGGVLFDIDYQAPAQAFAKWGIANFDQLYSKASQSDIFDRLETGLATESELFDHIRTTTGVNLTDEQIREAWNAILIGLPTPRVLWLNQVHPLFRTFILSNTNAIHAREFEHMIDQHAGWRNFAEGFEEVVYSHVLGARKPHVKTSLLMLKISFEMV